MVTIPAILVVLLAYLLGSIPFGILLTRAFGAGDLRSIGSGNIGATNVLRTGRRGLAAGTLLLDLAKGATAVCLARWIVPDGGGLWQALPARADILPAAAGVAAVIGHCFPVWLKFRGGKGVATLMGVSLALAWPIGLVYAVVWLGVLAVSRISALSGMAAAVSAPLVALALDRPVLAGALAVLAVLVLWLHRANIARLQAGTEPRIGSKS